MRSISRLAVVAAALIVSATALVASEDSVRLARVIEKPEDLATVFADAQMSVTYDSATGRFYYPSLGLYFDPITSLFYDPTTGRYRDQALQGEYYEGCMSGMYYDSLTGFYFDPVQKMTYDAMSGAYFDQETGLSLFWDSGVRMFYNPQNEGKYYDRGLGIYLTYDQQKDLFRTDDGKYYDPELGLYYDEEFGLFYDPLQNRYYDRETGEYRDPDTGSITPDAAGHLHLDAATGYYFCDLDGHYYWFDSLMGLYCSIDAPMDGCRLFYDAESTHHIFYNSWMYYYYEVESGNTYDPMSGLYYDSYTGTYYRYDATTGFYVDDYWGLRYVPYWLSDPMSWTSSTPPVDVPINQIDLTSRDRMYTDMMVGCWTDGHCYYYDERTDIVFFFDPCTYLYYDIETGDSYLTPTEATSRHAGSVDISNMYWDDMYHKYYDPMTGLWYDDTVGLYYDGMSYYAPLTGDCYWYDGMSNRYINSMTGEVWMPRSSTSAGDSEGVDLSNMYFDSMYGMYYDPYNYRWYDDTMGLYFDGLSYFDLQTGDYYWYDSMMNRYVNSRTGSEWVPKSASPTNGSNGIDMSTKYWDDMYQMYYDWSMGYYYDDKVGLYYDGMNYYDPQTWDSYWYDSMSNCYVNWMTGEAWVPKSSSRRSRNFNLANMVYDDMYGMYYDPSNGYYFDPTVNLYYDGMSCYYDPQTWQMYYYDSMQDFFYNPNTGERYQPRDAITGLTQDEINEIKNSFLLLGEILPYANTLDPWDTMTEPISKTVSLENAYYVAPFGAADVVWFDQLLHGSPLHIRLRASAIPLQLEIEVADGWSMAPSFRPVNLFVEVPESVWNRATRSVILVLEPAWSSMMGIGGLGNGNSMFYWTMTPMTGIEGVDSEADFAAYSQYVGNGYYENLFSMAVFRGCWSFDDRGFGMAGVTGCCQTVSCQWSVGGLHDSDGDGLADVDEFVQGTNPVMYDTDGDGLNDALELRIGSSPTMYDPDSDGDGMADVWEEHFGFNPQNPVDANADPDHDGLINHDECWLGTNPIDDDTDSDGLRDGQEIKLGTQPCNPDTDNDGVLDGTEVKLGSDPLVEDTDGDGLKDGLEIVLGTSISLADTDNDGLDDLKEFIAGTDPLNADSDGDCLSDYLEFYYESDPLYAMSLSSTVSDGELYPYFVRSPGEAHEFAEYWVYFSYLDGIYDLNLIWNNDSDGDNLTDWCEFLIGTDPLDSDSDQDGLIDGDEIEFSTDPCNPDTDMDGLSDWEELQFGTDPLKECSLRAGLKDGFAVLFENCMSPLDVMPDGRTAYEHALYSGDPNGEIDNDSAVGTVEGSDGAFVTLLVRSYVGNPATLHVGDLEVPLLPNAEIPIRVRVPMGYSIEIKPEFEHWDGTDRETEEWYRDQMGEYFDYYNEKVEVSVMDASAFTVVEGDSSYPDTLLLTSYDFPKYPLCIHDKQTRSLEKYYNDIMFYSTYSGELVECQWELIENTEDVIFTDLTPIAYYPSVHVKASFPDSVRRHCRLTYRHTNYVAGPTSTVLEVRYCPEIRDSKLNNEITNGKLTDAIAEGSSTWHGEAKTPASELELYHRQMPPADETNAVVVVTESEFERHPEDYSTDDETNKVVKIIANDQLILREFHSDYREYFRKGEMSRANILDPNQVKYDAFTEPPKGYCCPCPDHAHGHIGVNASSRVELFHGAWGTKVDDIDLFPAEIYTVGKRPSTDIQDALVVFTTNGAEYVKHRYTVLGVNIDVPYVELKHFNDLNKELGMPLLVGTNVFSSVLKTSDVAMPETLRSAPRLNLQCNVGLTTGVVRVSFGDIKGHFRLCAIDPQQAVTVLIDTADKVNGWQKEWKIEDWWKLIDSGAIIRLVAVERGSCTLHFSYGTIRNGKLYRDAVSQRFTAVYPLILPDYNRDGKIDDEDAYSYQNGRMYYFWENDDTWQGNDGGENHGSSANSENDEVDGRFDLLNFTPFAICINGFGSIVDNDTFECEITTDSNMSDTIKFVPCPLKWGDLMRIHQGKVQVLGSNKEDDLYQAELTCLKTDSKGGANSYTFDKCFIDVLKSNDDTGVIVTEFPSVHLDNLSVKIVSKETKQSIISSQLPVKILNVMDMMRWINLRHFSAQDNVEQYPTTANNPIPVKWPDCEHANANVVFLHGYNVNELESRTWAASVFKHLWWSGLNAGFTAVSWPGSVNQKNLGLGLFDGTRVTVDYHGNVSNAYMTASHLVEATKCVPGEKFYIAHSLGNMVVSYARQDFKLPYNKYFMLNAAVTLEAYDPPQIDLSTREARREYAEKNGMIPKSWKEYDPVFWACRWYGLFDEKDGRHGLTWKNRFKDVDNTVNYYSSEDEVLANGDGSFERIVTRDHVWYNQEWWKGKLIIHAPNGGWKFRSKTYPLFAKSGKAMNDRYYKNRERTKYQLQAEPVFKDFSRPELQTRGDYLSAGSKVAQDPLTRAILLGMEIPAEAYSAGANPVRRWGVNTNENYTIEQSIKYRNVDMAKMTDNSDVYTWFDRHTISRLFGTPPPSEWAHAYFALMPQHRVHQLYDDIVRRISISLETAIK